MLMIPDTPPPFPSSQSSPPTTPTSSTTPTSPPTTPTSQHHPFQKQLPSYVSCPDFKRPQSALRTALSSEQNWDVESNASGLSASRGSSGYESVRSSGVLQREDSEKEPQKETPASPTRRLTIGTSSELSFWEELTLANEKDQEKEKEVELDKTSAASPRTGSLVRSARRNFAMAVLTEHAISKMGDGNLPNGNGNLPNGNGKGLSHSQTMSQVIALHMHEVDTKEQELSKKVDEVTKKNEELEKNADVLRRKDEELTKKDEEIEDLKRKLHDESTRTRLFREKFQDMQKRYHELESREREKPHDHVQLIADNEQLKKKVADERERRRFYHDKFQETQKLYQESLDSVVQFQEKIRMIQSAKSELGAPGGQEPKKLEAQLMEEKLRTKFFKEKFQEMNRLYQESLESVTTFVERSRTAEKMYRSSLEDAQHSKRKTVELEGLYIETQESVAFFKYFPSPPSPLSSPLLLSLIFTIYLLSFSFAGIRHVEWRRHAERRCVRRSISS